MAKGFESAGRTKEKLESDLTTRAEQLLSKLDLQVLADILRMEKKRSGVESEDPEIKTEFDSKLPAGGAWDILDKRIVLNLARNYQLAEEHNKHYKDSRTFENFLASGFVHELTHAYSHNSCIGPDEFLSTWVKTILQKDPKRLQQSGYRQVSAKRGLTNTKYTSFNEAVTDMLAQEVFTEYKNRTADDVLQGEDYMPSYLVERDRLETFIVLVCQSVKASPAEVWRAIKHGYFSGLDLEDSELGRIYDDLVTSGLSEKSPDKEDHAKTNEIVRVLRFGKLGDGSDVPTKLLERIQFALQELSNSGDKNDLTKAL